MEFDQIYTRDHCRIVSEFCWRALRNAADVDDVCQEVFLRASQNLTRVRDENIVGWLITIARNETRSFVRKRNTAGMGGHRSKSKAELPAIISLTELALFDEPVVECLDSQIFLREILAILDQMGPAYARPVMMFAQGYSASEIGQALGIVSAVCVWKRVWTARRRLRKLRRS